MASLIAGTNRALFRMLALHSSSRMCVMTHNSSARKQRLHLQSVAGISHHSALSEDRIRQCETSSESRGKDTDQCLQVAISFCRHRSVSVPCENGSVEPLLPREPPSATVVSQWPQGGQNLVAGLWGHTVGGNQPPEPTSSYAIDF